MQNFHIKLAVILSLLCMGSTAAFGQTAYGSINGTVADASGAVIPGATAH